MLAQAAAVLPGPGGARLALAGLQSSAGGFTLRVLLAEGRLPPPRITLRLQYAEALSWQAADSSGRRHIGSLQGGDADRGQLFVRFSTPLDPSAVSAEIWVTGDGRDVKVTVPLSWTRAAG